MSFLRTLVRHLLNATPSHRLEIDRRRERNQSFICADVGSRFLAPDVLFASRERQHKTAPAILVVSFADQSSGNLSRVFVARREQANVWATVRQRHAKRLTFGDDDVCAASAG